MSLRCSWRDFRSRGLAGDAEQLGSSRHPCHVPATQHSWRGDPNEGCRQHQRPQSRASEGILQTKGKALPQALSFQERSATLQKNKALAKKWCKEEVTVHCPPDWDLLLLPEVFPGCLPIWASPSNPILPSSGDAGGDTWPRLQHCKPPHTPQNISRLHLDKDFKYVTGVWIHLTGHTGNGGVRRGFAQAGSCPASARCPSLSERGKRWQTKGCFCRLHV